MEAIRIDQDHIYAALSQLNIGGYEAIDESEWDWEAEANETLTTSQLKRQKSVKIGMIYDAEETQRSNPDQGRVVSLRAYAYNSEEYIYFMGYCYESGGPRSFRLDRIINLYEPVTGEVLDKDLFFSLIVDSEKLSIAKVESGLEKVYSRCFHAINFLLCVAHADGIFCDNELPIVVDYISDQCHDITYDEDSLIRVLKTIEPSNVSLGESITKICKMGETGRSRLLRTLNRLINADSKMDSSEFEIAVQLRNMVAEFDAAEAAKFGLNMDGIR